MSRSAARKAWAAARRVMMKVAPATPFDYSRPTSESVCPLSLSSQSTTAEGSNRSGSSERAGGASSRTGGLAARCPRLGASRSTLGFGRRPGVATRVGIEGSARLSGGGPTPALDFGGGLEDGAWFGVGRLGDGAWVVGGGLGDGAWFGGGGPAAGDGSVPLD